MRALSEEAQFPVLLVKEPALSNNLKVMADYATAQGFLLAPHGKTTMAPKIFQRQLAAGAWGITVANMAQAQVAFDAGAQRVLVANEVVGLRDAQAASRQLAAPGRELYCLVDSPEGARALDADLGRAGAPRRLRVLVELGAPGRRAGARTVEDALAVAREVAGSPNLALVGAEGFEGVLAEGRSPEELARVDAYLLGLRSFASRLADAGLVEEGQLIVSAGGSKYFDRVAALLGEQARLGGHYGAHGARLIVRAGCYVVHDHGTYARSSPLSAPGATGKFLQPALELWAEVLSVPEPGLAIVGLGKRDAPYDLDLPVPIALARRGVYAPEAFAGAALWELNDQHGYLSFSRGGPLPRVGDLVGFGISHPCTAFDKWRAALLVDEDYEVRDELATFFH